MFGDDDVFPFLGKLGGRQAFVILFQPDGLAQNGGEFYRAQASRFIVTVVGSSIAVFRRDGLLRAFVLWERGILLIHAAGVDRGPRDEFGSDLRHLRFPRFKGAHFGGDRLDTFVRRPCQG